ncbi:hypothetical protein G6F57_021429 [Rhizopus arrhizus]|nr:hypothetical protein G6F60_014191 [Rhizopus arrhizus]KAG1434781.1 hypothetical protein G6F57_021429 [Rhizopus arrhizus]
MDRDRAGAQAGDQLLIARRPGVDAAGVFLGQALGAQAADSQAQQRVGHQAAFGQAKQAGGGAVNGEGSVVQGRGRHGVPRQDLGNHGKKADVRRWYSR